MALIQTRDDRANADDGSGADDDAEHRKERTQLRFTNTVEARVGCRRTKVI